MQIRAHTWRLLTKAALKRRLTNSLLRTLWFHFHLQWPILVWKNSTPNVSTVVHFKSLKVNKIVVTLNWIEEVVGHCEADGHFWSTSSESTMMEENRLTWSDQTSYSQKERKIGKPVSSLTWLIFGWSTDFLEGKTSSDHFLRWPRQDAGQKSSAWQGRLAVLLFDEQPLVCRPMTSFTFFSLSNFCTLHNFQKERDKKP